MKRSSPGIERTLSILAVGIALTLTGLVISPVMLAVGALTGVCALALWIRDARREYRALHD